MRGQDLPLDRRYIIILIAALMATGIWVHAFISPKTLDVTVMDVGEGLCVVTSTPSGKVMVMDCGTSSWRKNETVGESAVAPYLRKLGKGRIDVAVLSHPHSDHVSGYSGLLEQTPASLVLDIGATEHASPLYRRFLRTVKKCGSTYRIAKRGQEIDMKDGVILEILNPAPSTDYFDLNNRSIVLRIVYKNVAIILAADAEEPAETDILDSGLPVRAQVLQVGHHGSEAGSSTRWLEEVNPSMAVISCGRRNKYGHPSSKTVDRLTSYGARVYRTDKCGAVTISTDGRIVHVDTCAKTR